VNPEDRPEPDAPAMSTGVGSPGKQLTQLTSKVSRAGERDAGQHRAQRAQRIRLARRGPPHVANRLSSQRAQHELALGRQVGTRD
jgi:hypothetical protein